MHPVKGSATCIRLVRISHLLFQRRRWNAEVGVVGSAIASPIRHLNALSAWSAVAVRRYFDA